MYVYICAYIFCTSVYLYLIVYNWFKNGHFNIFLIYFELDKHVFFVIVLFCGKKILTYLLKPFSNINEIQDAIKIVFKFDVKSLCCFLLHLAWQKSGTHIFFLARFPSSGFKTFHLLFVVAFLISNGSPIFRLWFCYSFDKVLGFIQLNSPWHSWQLSVAADLSHFPLKLSCWYSMVLVMTFFLVLPIYRAL